MDCVNHSGTTASAYCQNCGKPLCAQCVRHGVGGQVFCEQCAAAWQRVAPPVGMPVSSAPNPVAAGILGIIPGVGAMYNGQFFKGLIHVIIFVVLVSLTDRYDVFGIFIAAWVLYQAFEAYHTAKARRDGQPIPDPLGLNEIGNWFNFGGHPPQTPPQAPGAPFGGQSGQAAPNPGSNPDPNPGPYAPPASEAYQQVPYQQVPYTQPGANPGSNPASNPASNPGAYPGPNPGIPPMPPVPPPYWRRKEPVGAIVLIALGLIFLFNQMGYITEHIIDYGWPLILIALGAWLIVRRVNDSRGGSR
jgi:hypothetical protein